MSLVIIVYRQLKKRYGNKTGRLEISICCNKHVWPWIRIEFFLVLGSKHLFFDIQLFVFHMYDFYDIALGSLNLFFQKSFFHQISAVNTHTARDILG